MSLFPNRGTHLRLKLFDRNARQLWRRWLGPILPIQKTMASFGLYVRYLSDWHRYKELPGAEPLHLGDGYPCLFDRTTTTPFDAHYFYQDIWAFKAIHASGTQNHVDVGSALCALLELFLQLVVLSFKFGNATG